VEEGHHHLPLLKSIVYGDSHHSNEYDAAKGEVIDYSLNACLNKMIMMSDGTKNMRHRHIAITTYRYHHTLLIYSPSLKSLLASFPTDDGYLSHCIAPPHTNKDAGATIFPLFSPSHHHRFLTMI